MPKESLYKSSDKAVRVLKSTLFGSLREYLFWIVFLVASRAWGSKLLMQNHNCGPELGSLACASPHPLLHVYFNYSLHFASNFHHEPPPPPVTHTTLKSHLPPFCPTLLSTFPLPFTHLESSRNRGQTSHWFPTNRKHISFPPRFSLSPFPMSLLHSVTIIPLVLQNSLLKVLVCVQIHCVASADLSAGMPKVIGCSSKGCKWLLTQD